ncbi:FtsK/SpoIIIE family DNA translocase [Chlamydiifrater phoenicopteri]|uniref:FtsK/SpoIIIE family DNA translocase n=1 Tax=Chlamydiifrater phoenicopteri TaxID=2681469 RepID=UPI001BD1A74B|nr:DNA translocase FtsK [Chlamydiifrater phoenicopteri]
MSKEKKAPKFSILPSLPPLAKAIIYLFWSCFSCLSLISFHPNQPCTQNWIGLLGWSLSTILTYSFGAAALAFPPYLFLLSVLNFKKTPLHLIRKKHLALVIALISLSFLLSMASPTAVLPSYLENKLPRFSIGLDSPVSYLGGIPFYIAYTGQSICVKHLIGRVGTAVLFSTSLVGAILYLSNGLAFAKKKNLGSSVKKRLYSLLSFLKKVMSNLLDKRKYLPKPSIKITSKQIGNPLIPTILPSSESSPPPCTPLPTSSKPKDPLLLITPHPQERSLNSFIQSSPARKSSLENKKHDLTKSFPKTPFPSDSSKITPLPLTPQPKITAQKTTPLRHPEEFLPDCHLLSKKTSNSNLSLKEELKNKAQVLHDTLSSFGIEVSLGNICSGPTLASFEVLPQTGVKVQKIKALENDIALNLQASSIRIIAPIPGKAAVGIEIPNPYPQEVSFRDLLEDYRKSSTRLQIPLLLGKKANGENLWADLATMPHLIIAGTTGSGKSVCINAIVMSIIMTTHPSDIKLVIVDPKKVELTGYSELPHMLSPVVTEAKDAHSALIWLVKEMEQRYEILRRLGLRNIQSFNSRTVDEEIEGSLDLEIPSKMPFIVGIIDELADLLLSSSQDVETPIVRLAQMARAVGIHLILATQRPSREVITGLIKANFPSRISFKVSSRINSQIVIDEPGAEILMGNGDMLFLSPSSFGTIRAQGAYIRDDDINRVIQDLCKKFPTNYVVPSFDISDLSCDVNFSEKDPLLQQAKDLILQTGNASTTFLQRKLKVGYARAASLMDQLEEAGVIGPSEGAKPRKILSRLHPPEHLQ